MTLPPIHINTPVWGTAYTRCFLDIGLASLLAPGNLRALRREDGHLIHLMTTEADREVIERSPVWQQAQSVLDCHIDVIGSDAVAIDQPHLTMSNCHRDAIAFADSRGAAIMLYNPDIVLADGAVRTLIRLLAEGKRAIQVVGLRLLKDEVVSLLMRRHLAPDRTAVIVSPRELMAIAMKNLHPLTMMHLRDAPGYDLMPQEVFWRVGDDGLVARCFHIHPILVYPRVRNAPFTTTVDDDYLRAACPDPSEEFVVTDSDLFCLCELSGLHRNLVGLPRSGDDLDVAAWASAHARPHHFEHFCRRILLHSRGTEGPEWQAACDRSDASVARILRHVVALHAGCI
jgi:hypothetical protein